MLQASIQKQAMRNALIVIVVLVVLGALGGGFYLVGPPAEERAHKFDARRESDLQRLRLAADLYLTRNKRLPASLDELPTRRQARTSFLATRKAVRRTNTEQKLPRHLRAVRESLRAIRKHAAISGRMGPGGAGYTITARGRYRAHNEAGLRYEDALLIPFSFFLRSILSALTVSPMSAPRPQAFSVV